MPRLLAADIPQERILKEYIAGQTVAELLKEGRMNPGWLRQVQAMCGRLYPAGLNIDYYPTNFVPCGGTLYYIDYECNAYMQEWDFAHWGARYWTMTGTGKAGWGMNSSLYEGQLAGRCPGRDEISEKSVRFCDIFQFLQNYKKAVAKPPLRCCI